MLNRNLNTSTDTTMIQIWLHLVRDFRSYLGQDYAQQAEESLARGIVDFRSYKWPDRLETSVSVFKADYQLENLFKRYRFQNDAFSDEQLQEMAVEKFIAFQQEICSPLDVTPIVYTVLQRARKICKRILGQYDPEEHANLCRFGKRASVGNPYAKSYLDLKLSGTISGSKEHIAWFTEVYLPSDKLLADVLGESSPTGLPSFDVCDTLTLTNVPKSFKSLRSILPNTTIGSFYTYGLGRVFEERLRSEGLDIRILQKVHGILAKRHSKDRRGVTGDLTGASDAPVLELAQRMLPYQWLKATKLGRIDQCRISDRVIKLRSFMTMGIGFTFTLETLLFYALLKAIAELMKCDKRISVYGDDLIYPREIHPVVKHVFPKLHLKFNMDKTFVESYFRESCGSDFYHGADVRPFQPEGSYASLGRQPYTMFLYKCLNGLLRRWDVVEIPQTVRYLITQIQSVDTTVLRVPPSFPDEAGLKCSDPKMGDWFVNWSPVLWSTESQKWIFRYYRTENKLRAVKSLSPYYWEALRLGSVQEAGLILSVSPDIRWDEHTRRFIGTMLRGTESYEEPSEMLTWRATRPQPRNYRSTLTGKRLRKYWAFVTDKTKPCQVRKTGSTSSWI